MEKFLDTPVKRYTSGMYVGLAFAVAAHIEPEILIVDEVLAVGDAEFQKKCLGKMQDVSRGGRTVLFVSHQMEAIQTLCSRCIFLKNGQQIGNGVTSEIITVYLKNKTTQYLDNRWSPENKGIVKPVAIVGFSVEGESVEEEIATGSFCRFVMHVQAQSNYSNVRVAFGVDDKYGHRLFTLDTSNYRIAYNLQAGINRICCELKTLPLRPDDYNVHLFIGSEYEAYDYINGDAEFTVIASRIHRHPRIDNSHGPIVLTEQWGGL